VSGSDKSTLTYRPNLLLVLFVVLLLAWLTWYNWMVFLFWDVTEMRRGVILEILAPFIAVLAPLIAVETGSIIFRNWSDVLKVSAKGVHDKRITLEPVPWTTIDSLALIRRFGTPTAIRVNLKPEFSVGKFGNPRFLSRLIDWRLQSARTFTIGTGMEHNAAAIANDINRMSDFPLEVRAEQ